jgi:methionyl-tRNA formyltransferase
VFRVDEGMDTGPVLRRLELPLDHPDVGSALEEYARRGAPELVAAFDDLAAGTAVETPQSGESSHAEKITVNDAHLDLSAPAAQVINRARGTSPAPGPWVELDGKRTKLFGLIPAPEATASGPVGELTTWQQRPVLRCGDGWVRVEEIQPFGKPRMNAADFLRGRGDVTFDPYTERQA